MVEIGLNRKIKIVLVVCYVPPLSPLSSYVSFVISLEWLYSTLSINQKVIIMGDFNLPTASFTSDNKGLNVDGVTSECSDTLFDFFPRMAFCNTIK